MPVFARSTCKINQIVMFFDSASINLRFPRNLPGIPLISRGFRLGTSFNAREYIEVIRADSRSCLLSFAARTGGLQVGMPRRSGACDGVCAISCVQRRVPIGPQAQSDTHPNSYANTDAHADA